MYTHGGPWFTVSCKGHLTLVIVFRDPPPFHRFHAVTADLPSVHHCHIHEPVPDPLLCMDKHSRQISQFLRPWCHQLVLSEKDCHIQWHCNQSQLPVFCTDKNNKHLSVFEAVMSPAVAEWKALRASGHCLEFCLLTSPAVAEWKALRASGHCLEFCLLMSPAVATALSFVCCRADSVTESLLSNSSTEILAGPCGVSNYFISCPIQFIIFYFLKLCRHLLLYSFTDCALLCYIVICSHIFTYLVDLINWCRLLHVSVLFFLGSQITEEVGAIGRTWDDAWQFAWFAWYGFLVGCVSASLSHQAHSLSKWPVSE